MASIIGFPNPVNEKAARTVAAGVLTLAVVTILLGALVSTSWLWLTALLAAGFVARVLTGPTLSPLGQLATRVVAPRLGAARLVPGPPKRFAQGMGATITLAAVIFQAFGVSPAVFVLLGLIVVAAGLESILGFCIGCAVFGWLMRRGVIPEETCAACADISLRQPQAA
jgi:uncharacterized protein DUF4395